MVWNRVCPTAPQPQRVLLPVVTPTPDLYFALQSLRAWVRIAVDRAETSLTLDRLFVFESSRS